MCLWSTKGRAPVTCVRCGRAHARIKHGRRIQPITTRRRQSEPTCHQMPFKLLIAICSTLLIKHLVLLFCLKYQEGKKVALNQLFIYSLLSSELKHPL